MSTDTAFTRLVAKKVSIGDADLKVGSQVYDSGTVDLDTGGATTTIECDLPADSIWEAIVLDLVEDVAGADATTLTASADSTDLVACGVSAGDSGKACLAFAGADNDVVLTLTGGSDQTPTGGSARVRIVYRSVESS